jgi:PAS domain S-box-containing protein
VHAGLDSQAGYTLQADEPVIVDDLETEQRFSGPALLTNHQVHSGLSSIIRDGDQRYGVIGVHGRARGQFNAEDAQFLQTVGTVVGSAVGRWLTRVRAAIERGVLRVISEAWAWHEAVDQVFACFARELGTTVAQLWTPDAHGALHCERTYAQRTEIGSAELAASAPEREPWIVERLRDQRRACWFTDRGLPTWPRPGESLSDLGLTSGFAVPVVAGSDFLGALMLYSPDRLIADEALLRSFEVLGRALGDYYVRLDFEQRTAHLAAITESAHDAIWSYDADGRISDWLSGAERLFGYAREEIVGRSIEQLVPDERLEEFWNVTSRIRDGEVLGPFATRRRCKDGRIVDVSVRCSAIHGRDGSITGVASTDRDITAEKDAERKLIEADRQKDEFLAMLGHELRNPLAAIQSTSELLKASCDGDEKLSRMQGILHRQTRHMAKLLDGLLDVSRIIRGKVELDTQPVDLAEVCRETVSDLESRVGQRKLELRVEVPPEPLWVEGDPVRLRQVVDNLLSNAVKYTPDGGSVVLRLTEREDRAEIRVDDTGVGIEPELLPFIFDVFRQSEQSMDRAQGGLGLGLALVRSLTELHQGTVEATSGGADTGASFRVMLPRTDGGGSPWRGQPAGPSGAKRIVLIEDNAELAEMLRQLLEISGHEVLVAGGGREGLRLVKRSQPDVVLCDLGLPDGVSGFDVARDLRADPETRTLPVVALTGYGRSEDKQAGMEAGFDAHLTKPVEADTLDRLLARLERSRRHDT